MALRVALLGLGLFQVATGVVAGDLALDQRALLLEGDRLPREAALDRLQQVRFAFREAAPEAGEWPLWSRTCGIQGSWDDAGLERRGEGLLMGMDRALGGQWIGGVLGGVARARLDHDQGHGRTDSRYLGVYAATRVYNQLGFRLGLLHGWHELERRDNARSWQLFGESSYAMDYRNFTLEPFAGLALVHLDADARRFDGLRLAAAHEQAGYLTLGWRLAAPWYWQQRKWVGRASLTLRQNLGSDRLRDEAVDGQGVLQQMHSREFERSSLRLDLSLDHELSRSLYLGLTYVGHYAEDARDNALVARLSLKF